ncbi:putative cation channel family transporter [Scheffersomyces amazonensis]|uniref:putative cation channel family transporter n=1 Tax=Scheffersomyces amazonensis TaxID=1078765 RepID=UPI00315C68FA
MRIRDFNVSQTNHAYPVEFKYLYFCIQKLVNKKVTLSLKYEQLKTPEIYSTLIKPLIESTIKFSENKIVDSNRNNKYSDDSNKVSNYVVFILLLIRYEFLIQSENNLILFELLITKANVCELLAIRMLREYKSYNRIKLLFMKPMNSDNFNTLELGVLSNSKRFLSQPIIVRILDRFYKGELIDISDNNSVGNSNSTYNENDDENGLFNHDIVNYKFNKISFKNVIKRSNIVPKYQSIVINLKLTCFMALYFFIILNKKKIVSDFQDILVTSAEIVFWLMGFNFNLEFIIKLINIEMKYFNMIIWNYIDFILILLIDTAFILKVIKSDYFDDLFSVISIVLVPRILSMFNNYRFFNLIIVSFNRMMFNLIGLICFFITLISGFYFSFISLSKNRSNYDIMFDMTKIFFGFTPSVWNNWDNYNTLGKIIQMGYLFLIQFIIGTILAIVLGQIFSKVNDNNQEEFNYFKSINLILYFKMAKLNNNKGFGSVILNIFKLPIIIVIFIYELMLSKLSYKPSIILNNNELKHFTFLNKDDYDLDYLSIQENYDEESLLIQKSRRTPSQFKRRYSNKQPQMLTTPKLNQVQSISTLGGNYRSASTDSTFIDELLNKKYGSNNNVSNLSRSIERTKTNNSMKAPNRAFQKKSSMEILNRLKNLEMLLLNNLREINDMESVVVQNELPTDYYETNVVFQPHSLPQTIGSPRQSPQNQDGIYDIDEQSLDDIDSIQSDAATIEEPRPYDQDFDDDDGPHYEEDNGSDTDKISSDGSFESDDTY